MNKLMKIKTKASFVLACSVCFLTSCEDENYFPKPNGYHRIELPTERTYLTNNDDCPYSFEYPDYSAVITQENCNNNLVFPKFKAVIYGTYIKLSKDSLNDFFYHSEFSRKLAYEHRIKADKIEEQSIFNDSSNVYGVVYSIAGNVASNYQFFITDSNENFYRGSLYFDVAPNIDSIKPVLNYIKEDIDHIIKTFSWK